MVRYPPVNAGDTGDTSWIPGLGRSAEGGGNGKLLQYSFLNNHVDGEAWRAIVKEVTKSQTRFTS